MQIKFQDLKYQEDAINSTIALFEGQKIQNGRFTYKSIPDFNKQLSLGLYNEKLEEDVQVNIGVSNQLTISDEQLLNNVRKVQLVQDLPQSESLYGSNNKFPQFNIEMETGTGKTLVYLKSILKLNQQYGFKKFVIVVPSIAIKEGVLKAYRQTKPYLKNKFNKVIYNMFEYDSNQLGKVQNFAVDNSIQIMLITMSSFNKEAGARKDNRGNVNVIYRSIDRLNGWRPIDLIAETRPILIIDEPQNVDNTDLAKKALNNLHPLFGLRYSATHRDKSYPTIYRLNAIDAYNNQLVKEIEVVTTKIDEQGNRDFMRLKSVESKKTKISAKIEVYQKTKTAINKTVLKFSQGDNIAKKTKLPVYEKYGDIAEIDANKGQEKVLFTGTTEPLTLATSTAEDIDEKRGMIREMIRTHFDKELVLNKMGIKVLSLIFLDRVSNYRMYDEDGNAQLGVYGRIFEEEYSSLLQKPKYQNLRDKDIPVDEVHAGYFAVDSKKRFKDSSGKTMADESEYEIIMRDKEGLLTMYDEQRNQTSAANKTRFIFSHSALKEGWDNPNVFQILTLADTKDDISKRQKIGRGLRIAVNQNGDRVPGFNVNTLTVVANQNYEDFARDLQHEYEEDGYRFGVFDDDTFATIIVKQGKTAKETKTFGRSASKKLVAEFRNNGYLTASKRATDKLKQAIVDQKLELSEDFKPFEPQIIEVAAKRAENLHIRDGNNRHLVKVREDALTDDFKALWDKISAKTSYHIKFDSNKLIEKVLHSTPNFKGMNDIKVNDDAFLIEKAKLEHNEKGIYAISESSRTESLTYRTTPYELPDIIAYLQNETNLTRKTIVKILRQTTSLDEFKKNPESYMIQAAGIINDAKGYFMVNGISYHKTGESYSQELFYEPLNAYYGGNSERENAVPVADDNDRTIYDYIVYDSQIEKNFAEQLAMDPSVKYYIKLPDWFIIPTPVGSYNPDWAVLKDTEDGEKLYFIAETKGTNDPNKLRTTESEKICSGKASFEAVDPEILFKQVTDESALRK